VPGSKICDLVTGPVSSPWSCLLGSVYFEDMSIRVQSPHWGVIARNGQAAQSRQTWNCLRCYVGSHWGLFMGEGRLVLFIARTSFLHCGPCWVHLFQHLVLMHWQWGRIS